MRRSRLFLAWALSVAAVPGCVGLAACQPSGETQAPAQAAGDRRSIARAAVGASRQRTSGESHARADSRASGPSKSEIEEVRLARAALEAATIPLYPGAQGLDATEFEANTAPFIAVDFFSVDPPEKVAAFYDRRLSHLTARRDTTLERGVVRYEFERAFSGVAVKPWSPGGADSLALLARFDRRDAQGVTSHELDAYGRLLRRARTHVVVNVPRPRP